MREHDRPCWHGTLVKKSLQPSLPSFVVTASFSNDHMASPSSSPRNWRGSLRLDTRGRKIASMNFNNTRQADIEGQRNCPWCRTNMEVNSACIFFVFRSPHTGEVCMHVEKSGDCTRILAALAFVCSAIEPLSRLMWSSRQHKQVFFLSVKFVLRQFRKSETRSCNKVVLVHSLLMRMQLLQELAIRRR